MKTYYTTKGQKVVIIGNLNSQEKIVQEIFIVDGKEIPSGENFIVKSLHDAPAISWEEKKTAEIKAEYELASENYKTKTEKLRQEIKTKHGAMSSLLKNLDIVIKHINIESFTRVLQFLAGEITHIVHLDYGTYEIREFIEDIATNEDYSSSELKLITLFGKVDGSLEWNINRYSDGSGGNTTIVPFDSYEAAHTYLTEHILEKINDRGVTSDIIKACKKHKISIPKEKMLEYYRKAVDGCNKLITEKRLEITTCADVMIEHAKKMEEL